MNLNPVGHYMNGVKVLDPTWIDVQSVKDWIRECNDGHHECHMNPAHLNLPIRLTVIDVKKRCVAVWGQNEPYIALSYVWGRTTNFELRLENRDEMFQVDSLEHRWEEIPQTIKDSILLTEKLGFRYLWVDSLCIIQDDEMNKVRVVNQMASIYSRAAITIVAGDGSDASHGLGGTGETPRYSTPQKLINITPHHQISSDAYQWPELSQKAYFHRGWTFQEYQLSPSLLIFLDDKVIFKCRTHERSEERLSTSEKLPIHQITTNLTWPDLKSYGDMVEQYNLRHTRDDNDVLAAFSGILGAINNHFPGGFWHGLPEFYFDVALLWLP
jgi:hypothetical protein